MLLWRFSVLWCGLMAETATKKTTKKEASTTKTAPKNTGGFAVIETGGKQYKVAVGDVVKVEKIKDKKEGDTVVFDKVLLADSGTKTDLGAPYIVAKKVEGKIVKDDRDPKLHVVRFRSKSRYFRKLGHRQPFMLVEITKI